MSLTLGVVVLLGLGLGDPLGVADAVESEPPVTNSRATTATSATMTTPAPISSAPPRDHGRRRDRTGVSGPASMATPYERSLCVVWEFSERAKAPPTPRLPPRPDYLMANAFAGEPIPAALFNGALTNIVS